MPPNVLKPALSRAGVNCSAARLRSTRSQYIEKDGALARRFQAIMVDPPSVEESIEILKGLRDRYEEHHHVHNTDEALEAVKLRPLYRRMMSA